jgi:hypothetical protein
MTSARPLRSRTLHPASVLLRGQRVRADRGDQTAPDVLSAVRRAIWVARGPRPLGFVGLGRDDAAIAEVA